MKKDTLNAAQWPRTGAHAVNSMRAALACSPPASKRLCKRRRVSKIDAMHQRVAAHRRVHLLDTPVLRSRRHDAVLAEADVHARHAARRCAVMGDSSSRVDAGSSQLRVVKCCFHVASFTLQPNAWALME